MFYDDLRDSSVGIEEKRNVRIIRILACNRARIVQEEDAQRIRLGKYSIFIGLSAA